MLWLGSDRGLDIVRWIPHLSFPVCKQASRGIAPVGLPQQDFALLGFVNSADLEIACCRCCFRYASKLACILRPSIDVFPVDLPQLGFVGL